MINGLAATSDGSLWVAAGGLGQLRGGKLQYPFEKEVKGDVTSLFLDSDGVLWILGANVKQLKARKVTSYAPAKGRSLGAPKCLVSDRSGTVWAGDSGGLFCVKAGVAAYYDKSAGVTGIVGAVLPD